MTYSFVCQGIVRYITDHPDGDNFTLESTERPDEFVGTLTGPRLWLEDHLGKTVCVIITDQHFSITVIGGE